LSHSSSLQAYLFIYCIAGVWTQGLHLEPLCQPFLVMGFFPDRISRTICPGWLLRSFWSLPPE
jgi:hypothetical protein